MVTVEQLKNYYPFNKMEEKFLPLLMEQFKVFEFERGDDIFQHDDNKVYAKYVIDGRVEITYPSGRQKMLKADSLSSYYPVGEVNSQKHLTSEVQSKSAKVMMLNNIFLDQFVVWDNLYKESSPDSPLRGHESYNWVVGLLNSNAMQMLPRGHVDQIFKSLEPEYVKNGKEVISEGDVGEYCYIIVNGSAGIYKCVAEGEEKIATLGSGALFGENALVSKDPRNASVRMETNGLLMRMAGENFSSLLKSHVVRWLTSDASYEMILEGAVLVDVRETYEFEESHFHDSVHIPLGQLRDESEKQLDKNTTVITCSNTGMRCASAAFLLATLGYDVYSMQGGVRGLLKLIEKPDI